MRVRPHRATPWGSAPGPLTACGLRQIISAPLAPLPALSPGPGNTLASEASAAVRAATRQTPIRSRSPSRRRRRCPRRVRRRSRSDATLAYAILTPTFLVILGLVAYPFFIGIALSLQNKMVGAPGRFVGLQNYVELFRNDLFLRTIYNTVVYTVVAVAIKFVLGLDRWP